MYARHATERARDVPDPHDAVATNDARLTRNSSPRADEREDTVNMYLEFHYANTLDLFAKKSFVPADALGFAERVTQRAVELGLALQQKPPNETETTQPIRALDIGCGVGGSAFHLAKGFDEVVAFDSSRAFIDACKPFRNEGT